MACVVGELIAAAALNIFIVPLNLYTGGLLGFCQVVRTLMQTYLHISFGAYDVAGIFYFVLNIPILLLAYKTLGRPLVLKTLVCTTSYSLFYSIIPIPSTPIVNDYLTACLLGGILVGVGSGIVLTCGGSGGGLDIVGLCLSKPGQQLYRGQILPGLQRRAVYQLPASVQPGSGDLLSSSTTSSPPWCWTGYTSRTSASRP